MATILVDPDLQLAWLLSKGVPQACNELVRFRNGHHQIPSPQGIGKMEREIRQHSWQTLKLSHSKDWPRDVHRLGENHHPR